MVFVPKSTEKAPVMMRAPSSDRKFELVPLGLEIPPVMFGLPNITGLFKNDASSYGFDEGVFYQLNETGTVINSGTLQDLAGGRIGFSASRSNAIYGAFTVQPSALLLLPCIKF